eukprot:5478942-Prymnesium_polylepis.1
MWGASQGCAPAVLRRSSAARRRQYHMNKALLGALCALDPIFTFTFLRLDAHPWPCTNQAQTAAAPWDHANRISAMHTLQLAPSDVH